MMCQKCRHTSNFQADLFQGPKPPPCPECEVRDTLRTSHAGKRSHGIGKLRPRIVLYHEHNPDDEAIGAVMTSDLRSRPDAIIVVGTSLKIPGVRRIVREMCGVVRSKQNGISMWINQDPVPPGKEFEDCWDLVVSGQCDEVARQADLKNWDDVRPEIMEEYTMSEGERVKSSQGEINVVIPETPTKHKDRLKKGPLHLGGMMTPPVSMDDEMSDRPQAIKLEKNGKSLPAKANLKVVVKNPASLGRSISEVLGKENKSKQSGRPKGNLNKRTLTKAKAPRTHGIITGKVTKPVGVSKGVSTVKEQKAPLSPRSNANSNILLFPNLSQQCSSTEPSPAPESPTENDWRTPDTILPNGSIPNGMAKLLN
jgi:NAD+-dependent protein deacetylase SIR2